MRMTIPISIPINSERAHGSVTGSRGLLMTTFPHVHARPHSHSHRPRHRPFHFTYFLMPAGGSG